MKHSVGSLKIVSAYKTIIKAHSSTCHWCTHFIVFHARGWISCVIGLFEWFNIAKLVLYGSMAANPPSDQQPHEQRFGRPLIDFIYIGPAQGSRIVMALICWVNFVIISEYTQRFIGQLLWRQSYPPQPSVHRSCNWRHYPPWLRPDNYIELIILLE